MKLSTVQLYMLYKNCSEIQIGAFKKNWSAQKDCITCSLQIQILQEAFQLLVASWVTAGSLGCFLKNFEAIIVQKTEQMVFFFKGIAGWGEKNMLPIAGYLSKIFGAYCFLSCT